MNAIEDFKTIIKKKIAPKAPIAKIKRLEILTNQGVISLLNGINSFRNM